MQYSASPTANQNHRENSHYSTIDTIAAIRLGEFYFSADDATYLTSNEKL
jgi:hypothetical protein